MGKRRGYKLNLILNLNLIVVGIGISQIRDRIRI